MWSSCKPLPPPLRGAAPRGASTDRTPLRLVKNLLPSYLEVAPTKREATLMIPSVDSDPLAAPFVAVRRCTPSEAI